MSVVGIGDHMRMRVPIDGQVVEMNKFVKNVQSLLMNGGFPIRIGGLKNYVVSGISREKNVHLEIKRLQCSSGGKRTFRVRVFVLVSHMNVLDFDLQIFDDLRDQFFGESIGVRVLWLWKRKIRN